MPNRVPVSEKLYKSNAAQYSDRKELARNIKFGARKEKNVHAGEYRYNYLGNHYESLSKEELPYSRFKDEFNSHVASLIMRYSIAGGKISWLDIGPGRVHNFMPYFERIDPENKFVELHTLAPNQILPKKAIVAGTKMSKRLINARNIEMRNRIQNPDYEKWKTRLTHHVGVIETYPIRKLGTHHVIVSLMGGLYHNNHPLESMVKTAQMLCTGGKAFLEYLPSNANSNLVDKVEKKLGKKFTVAKKGPGLVVITKM